MSIIVHVYQMNKMQYILIARQDGQVLLDGTRPLQ